MIGLPLSVDFTGKVVVVTGTGGVLCGEMARAFAQARAKVATLDLNEEAVKKLSGTCKTKGLTCEGYKADVLNSGALAEVRARVYRTLGPCDILISDAGGNNPRATTDSEYQHEARPGQKTLFGLGTNGVGFVFELNFQGALLPAQVFARDMVKRGSGCILNISSMNTYAPLTKIPAYSGAETVISNFTQWPATYLAGTGIRRNTIAPGFLVSNQSRKLFFNEDGTPIPRTAEILAGTLMGRFMKSNELLGGTFFPCGDRAASAVTGMVLSIDAGFAACPDV